MCVTSYTDGDSQYAYVAGTYWHYVVIMSIRYSFGCAFNCTYVYRRVSLSLSSIMKCVRL